jgi:ATP-binding cassette, subfamily B, bacterial
MFGARREATSPGVPGEPARPKATDLRKLGPILGFLYPYRLRALAALCALVVAAAATLSIGLALRRVIDHGFRTGNPAMLEHTLVVLAFVIVILTLATFARFYLVTWIGERVAADIRRAVYGHVIGLSPAFFETTRTGELLSRITNDTTLVSLVVGTSGSIALRNLLLFIGGTVMLAITNPKLTLLVGFVVPIVIVPLAVFGRRVRRLSRASQDRLGDVGAYVEESINAVRTVQAFGHESVDRDRFSGHVETAFRTAVDRTAARASLTALVIFLVFGSILGVLWVGANDMFAGRITPGELMSFILFAIIVAGSVGALSEVLGDVQRAAGASERLAELLATKSTVPLPRNPQKLPQPARGEIAFENVRFRYPAQPSLDALNDFSLSVAAGEHVALVGPSGAGKSTVFSLLLRFYDPQDGTVRIDGVDLRQADPQEARARIGLVPQEPVIFGANAWENIRYGRPDAGEAEIRAAAEAAHATEFLDRLPQGFATFLGEKGVRLSVGQRQRIAIARAILRDPAVLLLDEATSSLDSESERYVQDALARLMRGRTTLVIAHRLATVQGAHRIAVIEEGRLAAIGTHGELLRQGGIYARLAALQFGFDVVAGRPAPA